MPVVCCVFVSMPHKGDSQGEGGTFGRATRNQDMPTKLQGWAKVRVRPKLARDRQETRGTKKEPATKTPKNGRVDREANFAEGGPDSGKDHPSAP